MTARAMSSAFGNESIAQVDALLDQMTDGYVRELLLDAYRRGLLPEHKHPDHWRPDQGAMMVSRENCLLLFASLSQVCPEIGIDRLSSADNAYETGRLLALLPRKSPQLAERAHRKVSVRGERRNAAIAAARYRVLAGRSD